MGFVVKKYDQRRAFATKHEMTIDYFESNKNELCDYLGIKMIFSQTEKTNMDFAMTRVVTIFAIADSAQVPSITNIGHLNAEMYNRNSTINIL